MLKPIIYPYKIHSSSAKLLSSSLGTRRVYPDRNYRSKANHLIINWGNSTEPNWYHDAGHWLNIPEAVGIACDKFATFLAFEDHEVKHPNWTNEKDTAQFWIEEGYKVFCRESLTSHSGQGIVIASTVDELVDAPLYVQAVKKDKEYRVHVFQEQIIDYQQKKKRNGHEGGISGIRNHSNGWVYARSDVQLPEEVANESIKAVAALNLDFGAVDICTGLNGEVYTFEVNTAPGLYGPTTLQKYTEAFRSLL